ncbi:MAG: hypothetical protein M0T77_04505 [Actinomycetota bacterium]|nr:hypothetical protein [Actinomycetota bacterium]
MRPSVLDQSPIPGGRLVSTRCATRSTWRGWPSAWAGKLGLSYAFADFVNPDGAAITADYRRVHAEHRHDRTAVTAVAVWAICAETDEHAQYLASSSRMSMRLLRQRAADPGAGAGEGDPLPALDRPAG